MDKMDGTKKANVLYAVANPAFTTIVSDHCRTSYTVVGMRIILWITVTFT